MEGMLADLTRMLGGGRRRSGKGAALEEAQALMYEAWDATGPRRVALARQALGLSPDCADVFVLLAEETARSCKQTGREHVADALIVVGVQPEHLLVIRHGGLPLPQTPEAAAQPGAGAHVRPRLQETPKVAGVIPEALGTQRPLAGSEALGAEVPGLIGRDEELERLLAQYEEDYSATWLYTQPW